MRGPRRCRSYPSRASRWRFWIESKNWSRPVRLKLDPTAKRCSVRLQPDVTMNSDHIKEHLKFAAELGAEGVSRDPSWRLAEAPAAARSGNAGAQADPPASPAHPAPPAQSMQVFANPVAA